MLIQNRGGSLRARARARAAGVLGLDALAAGAVSAGEAVGRCSLAPVSAAGVGGDELGDDVVAVD
jgi:hypothetical protein